MNDFKFQKGDIVKIKPLTEGMESDYYHAGIPQGMLQFSSKELQVHSGTHYGSSHHQCVGYTLLDFDGTNWLRNVWTEDLFEKVVEYDEVRFFQEDLSVRPGDPLYMVYIGGEDTLIRPVTVTSVNLALNQNTVSVTGSGAKGSWIIDITDLTAFGTTLFWRKAAAIRYLEDRGILHWRDYCDN